jgi:hypothetical protein
MIRKLIQYNYSGYNAFVYDGGRCSDARLATPEEVAKVEKPTISRETYPKPTEITQASFDRNFHVKVKSQEEADAMFKWLESKGESIWHTNRGLKWDKNWTYIGFSGNAWKTAENHMPSIKKSPEKLLSNFITIPAQEISSANFDNCKIWIGDNPELSKKVQEKLFELGYGWANKGKIVKYEEATSLYTVYSSLAQESSHGKDFFNGESEREITPADLGIYEIPMEVNSLVGMLSKYSEGPEKEISYEWKLVPEPKVSEIKEVQPLKRVEVKKFKVKSI